MFENAAFVKMPLTVPNMFQHVSRCQNTVEDKMHLQSYCSKTFRLKRYHHGAFYWPFKVEKKTFHAFHTLHLAPATISPLCVIFEVKRQVGSLFEESHPSCSGVAGGWAMPLEMIPNGSTIGLIGFEF